MIEIFEKIPSVAYLAGFVGCAVISYVLYPQPKSKRHYANVKNGYPRGLINCRNECFINVILQSLAASKKVTQWLLLNKSSTISSKNLLDTLANIIIRINRLESTLSSTADESDKKTSNFDQDQEEFYAAQSFKSSLQAHKWEIQSEEHDCHELFHLIMDILDEEQIETKKSLTSLNYFSPSHLKENSSLKTKNPFHGYLINQLQCLDCLYKYPLRLESFYSLSLILPQQKPNLISGPMNSITLIECINNYFKTEHITGMKCENCAKLNENKEEKKLKGFIKKQAIAKLPETLALHIQRNSWSDQNFEMIKQTNYVQFPLSIKIDNPKTSKMTGGISHANLTENSTNNNINNASNFNIMSMLNNKHDFNMNSSFSLRQVGIGGLLGGNKSLNSCINVQTNRMKRTSSSSMIAFQNYQYYELKSAIVHYGNAVSGHFVSFRKRLDKQIAETAETETRLKDWLQISDSEIKVCKENHLLQSSVYMLFYDKVSNVV